MNGMRLRIWSVIAVALVVTISAAAMTATEAIKERQEAMEGVRNGLMALGAIAKGYAVDQAAKALQKNNIHHAFINAGGDLKTLGRRPDKTAWKIGLQHPRKPESILASFSLSGKAVATSGDYQKYFNHEGTRYHHILNPKTGYPVTGMTSATVVTDTVMDADALSTALFVMGAKKGMAFIDSLKNTKGLIVDQNQPPQLSQGMKDLADFSLESFKENLSH